MTEKILKIIQKSLGVEAVSLEDHLHDDLNIHPEDWEELEKQLREKLEVEFGERELQKMETVAEIVEATKDKLNDVS